MKSFDSRTYSINDFLEWHERGQLVLDPKFQRRPVWTDKAKSYLMDTIVRGKPIPKIFIRQRIDVATRSSIREVVDGQQRLRTILSYLSDGFSISKGHNPEYGGHVFSGLGSVNDSAQARILSYELSVDLLVDLSDAEVLDIFSRLNSYAVVLNEQERLNATHFGPFKTLADRVGHKYVEYWRSNGIFTNRHIMRMDEVALTADILVAMLKGIRTKKQLKAGYAEFENKFPYDSDQLEERFDATMSWIARIYPEGLKDSSFRRPHLFYSLFTAIDHASNGLPGLDAPRPRISHDTVARVRAALERVDLILGDTEGEILSREEQQFLEDCRLSTADAAVRKRRTTFLLGLVESEVVCPA